MAALDAEIVNAFGKVERRVAFDAEIEKGVEPLTAGVEMKQRAFVPPFADGRIPGT